MIEAKLNKEYALRTVAVGVLMFGLAAWSIYDGMIGWPKINKQMDTVRPLLLENRNVTSQDWLTSDAGDTTGSYKLGKLFAEAGGFSVPKRLVDSLKTVPPPSDPTPEAMTAHYARIAEIFNSQVYSSDDLRSQYIQALVLALFGLLIIWTIVKKKNIRYYADDTGLSGNGIGPNSIAWSDIETIDWRLYQRKQIFLIRAKGSNRYVKMDGWHFAGMEPIVEKIKELRPELVPGTEENFAVRTNKESSSCYTNFKEDQKS